MEMEEAKAAAPPANTLRKIDWFKKSSYLNEAYQSSGFVFAFATAPDDKGNFGSCHEWVKCRDYLHDVVRTTLTSATTNIYGFVYEASNPLPDLKNIRMLVSQNDLKSKCSATKIEAFRRKMVNSLKLLNHFEDEASMPRSEMEEVAPTGSGRECVSLFTGSPLWLSSPFLISMYTFIIRLGDKEIEFTDRDSLKAALEKISNDPPQKKGDPDVGYLKVLWDKLHLALEKRSELFEYKDGFHKIFFDTHDIYTFHNRCGILSLFHKATPDQKLNETISKEVEQHAGANKETVN